VEFTVEAGSTIHGTYAIYVGGQDLEGSEAALAGRDVIPAWWYSETGEPIRMLRERIIFFASSSGALTDPGKGVGKAPGTEGRLRRRGPFSAVARSRIGMGLALQATGRLRSHSRTRWTGCCSKGWTGQFGSRMASRGDDRGDGEPGPRYTRWASGLDQTMGLGARAGGTELVTRGRLVEDGSVRHSAPMSANSVGGRYHAFPRTGEGPEQLTGSTTRFVAELVPQAGYSFSCSRKEGRDKASR